VAADETNITLTVTATDGTNTKTANVKVKGWMPMNLYSKFSGDGITLFDKIIYGNNRWIMFSSNGRMVHSDDGIEWTLSQGAVGSVTDVIYDGPEGGKKFIAAIGRGDKIKYSSDGEQWQEATVNDLPTSPNNYSIRGIAYGNGKFVAIEGYTQVQTDSKFGVFVSTDGITWNRKNDINIASYGDGKFGTADPAIAFGNGTFVCTLGYFGVIIKSTDGGETWTLAAEGTKNQVTGYPAGTDITKAERLLRIIYDGNKFIAVGPRSRIAMSNGNDLTSWSIAEISIGDTEGALPDGFFIFAGNKYVTSVDGFYNDWSPNGYSFSLIYNSSLTGDGASGWEHTLHAADLYNHTYTSFLDVAYGDGKFIVIGSAGASFCGIGIAYEETLD
jgi:photosystem II stability/assembly factor-like uncharacterized protein